MRSFCCGTVPPAVDLCPPQQSFALQSVLFGALGSNSIAKNRLSWANENTSIIYQFSTCTKTFVVFLFISIQSDPRKPSCNFTTVICTIIQQQTSTPSLALQKSDHSNIRSRHQLMRDEQDLINTQTGHLKSFQAHLKATVCGLTEEWEANTYMTSHLSLSGTSLIWVRTLVKQYKDIHYCCDYCVSLDSDWIKVKSTRDINLSADRPDLYFQDNKACIGKDDPAELSDAEWACSTIQSKTTNKNTRTDTHITKDKPLTTQLVCCIFVTSTLRKHLGFNCFSFLTLKSSARASAVRQRRQRGFCSQKLLQLRLSKLGSSDVKWTWPLSKSAGTRRSTTGANK